MVATPLLPPVRVADMSPSGVTETTEGSLEAHVTLALELPHESRQVPVSPARSTSGPVTSGLRLRMIARASISP